MKKLLWLILLINTIVFAQEQKDPLTDQVPHTLSMTKPVVEYQIVQYTEPRGKNNIEVITRLYVLYQGAEIFEIFAVWHNLVRNAGLLPKVYDRHNKYVKKELKMIGFNE